MKTVKILHCADVHIGAAESFLGEKAQSRRFETLITFEKIVDLAIKENVKVVAMAGDIFDSNSIEESFFSAVFKKIAEAENIKFIFAAGNHDPLDMKSPFLRKKLPENLYVLGAQDDCLVFDELSLCVYGRSFDSAFLRGKDQIRLTQSGRDYVNLMVQHGDLSGDMNSEYNAITQNFIASSGMDYIALGHIHKRSNIEKIGNTYFAYSGCAEGHGFDEPGEKGVYIGEIGKGICQLTFVPLNRRMYLTEKISIENITTNTQAAETIISALKLKHGDNFTENFYKISITGAGMSGGLDLEEIKSRLSEKLYFVKLKDKTELSVDLSVLSKEASLKGIFVKNMLEAINSADESEKEKYKNALKTGLSAFLSEVSFDAD